MNHDLIVSQSIDIHAGPAEVWEALTNPEIIKEYLYGTETVTDWEPGSDIVFQGEYNGTAYKDKGIILEHIPHKRLSYSYWSGFSGLEDKPENYSKITYHLDKIDDKRTKFTWEQKGFASEEGYNHSKTGMPAFMEHIKGIVEGNLSYEL